MKNLIKREQSKLVCSAERENFRLEGKTNIQIFTSEVFGEIRTCQVNNQIMFVGKDVATALGYTDPQKALKMHVDNDDKLTRQIVVSGQGRRTYIINESGLYSLILSSKLPQARQFKRWVTNEVLPQIRKTGGYIPTKDAKGRELSDMEVMCLAYQIQQKTIEARDRMIEELTPKANYCDQVLESVDCLTTTQVAKGMGMTANELNIRLCQAGIQYGQSGQYMLYAPYARKGYAQNRTHSYYDNEGEFHTNTYLVWTEAGRHFIHQLINKQNL